MRDFRIISTKVSLKITSASPIRGFPLPSMMVIGKDLYMATEVEMNGVEAAEFIVAAPNRLIVRIPDSQVGQPLSSIRAYALSMATASAAKLEMAMTSPSKSISGVDRMVQAFLLVFFTTPGTDIFDQASGGSARSLVGRSTDAQHQSVAADLALCIDRTKGELMRLQAKVSGVPLAERLLSASLSSVQFDASTSVLNAEIALKSMSGDAANVSLG